MTPQQKAEQLVQKFYSEVIYGNSTDYSERMLRIFVIKSKNCALIAVDEILNTIMSVYQPETKLFWIEVKKEIEAL